MQTCLFNDQHQYLMVFICSSQSFPSSSSFLSDFISWSFLRLVSCFQITLLPKGQALHYRLPLFIPCSSVFCPHGDQSSASVLSSQAPISSSFLSSFLLPKTRPMPHPSASPSKKKKVKIKLFLYWNRVIAAGNKGNQQHTAGTSW